MFRIENNHPFGKQRGGAFVGYIFPAYTSAEYVEEHMLATNGLVISPAHEFAQKLCLFCTQRILGSLSVHGYLGGSFQYFIPISADIKLYPMLKVRVVMLETFFDCVFYRAVSIFESRFQVGFVLFQTGTVNPVKRNVCPVGTRPFGRISAIFTYALQGFGFQCCRYLFLTGTHLYKQYADFLWFGNLVVPPVVTVRITFIPIFQSFHYLIVNVLALIVSVLRIGIGKSKIIQSVYVDERLPIGAVAAAVVYVGKIAFVGVVFV